MKDVGQMLAEIEEIEEQELKSFGQPQHNEKGLEEKKAKLHASIHRVARYYVSYNILEECIAVISHFASTAARGAKEGTGIETVSGCMWWEFIVFLYLLRLWL